ncbi:quinolinate synthase NadA [Thiothrix subterranea]|uniref:quinolinate synthase NadA n=1 Tax=Thiothrix subterranea TaxID=2735563 RepID=UPI00192C7D8B|nr:quinolinate synthase NadA [Thiothrix subterranea]QQZ28757.1 quinolinate synthase NadA [Thiothrix subterranea]
MEHRIESDLNVSKQETERLYALLANAGYQMEDCATIAPLTEEINILKQIDGVMALAHHYMTPDITFAIADYAEDALGLIRRAESSNSNVILMCSVVSLAECVKIACPDKKVLCSEKQAGCSVADSITAEDVAGLKAKYPNAPAVAYVTTSAEVKAVSDFVVTSANVRDVIGTLPAKQILFYPDHSMAQSLAADFPDKEIIGWEGTCVVHDNYTIEQVVNFRKQHPDAHVLFHSEVNPDLYVHGELTGGTNAMMKYVADHPEVNSFFMVTECGLSDQLRTRYPGKKFIGTCSLCPFMKMISLENILDCLRTRDSAKYEITIPDHVLVGAVKAYKNTEQLLGHTHDGC